MGSVSKKHLRRGILLCIILFLGIGSGIFVGRFSSQNSRFEAFTENIFRSEVSGNTLSLHYTLAYPEKQGIAIPPPTLGTIPLDMEKTCYTCENYEKKLKSFSPRRLSEANRITRDMLILYFHTQRTLGENYLLEEYLSPSLGIQAQLPVLLAEYSFCKDSDLTDYLKLLSQIRPYFQSILEFEKKKSTAGFFMCDATLDRVLAQCREFIRNPDSNYMQDVFARKLSQQSQMSKEDQERMLTYHKKLLQEQVIPAYQFLIDGLEKLRGTGKNNQGLFYFKGGREYYKYLIRSQTGSFLSVKKIQKLLSSQLLSDFKEVSSLLRKNPALFSRLPKLSSSISLSPEEMLKTLQEQIKKDFPALHTPSYELRYVHDSMKDFLSPAFYLTPPVDTRCPNVIYLNPAKNADNLEIYTTLAHESFPGHLYQSVSFAEKNPAFIRSIFATGGYVEGWATYVESYAYKYAASLMHDPDASDAARLAWLNKRLNLCIYSLLDIGIHYEGWDETRSAAFLQGFGIREASASSEIYRYITETPANYLKYYLGSLHFFQLKKGFEKQLGDSFNLKEFHRELLEIGPVQFPVLEKYMKRNFPKNIKKRSCHLAAPLV